MIVIPVMDSELANMLAAELARALGAHGRKQFQRARPIASKTVSAGPPRVGYELMEIVVVRHHSGRPETR